MQETRNFRIKDRILTLKEIKKIATKLEQEFKAAKKKKHHVSLNFSIKCIDDSVYDSESVDIFENDVIGSKKIHSVDFDFMDYYDKNRIAIDLEHGNSDYRNNILVSGNSSDWVNGKLSDFQTFINGAALQQTWFKKLKILFILLFSVVFGVIFLSLLAIVSRKIEGKPFLNPFDIMKDEPFIIVLSTVFGYGPAFLMIDWFNKLWPSLEIQVGPEHTFIERYRRELFFAITTFLLLPILFGLIFS